MAVGGLSIHYRLLMFVSHGSYGHCASALWVPVVRPSDALLLQVLVKVSSGAPVEVRGVLRVVKW